MDPREALQGIPQDVRRKIYTVLGVLGAICIGVGAFYLAAPAYTAPPWIAGVAAAIGAVGTPAFWIATANTKPADAPDTDAPQAFEEVGAPEADPVV